MFKDMPAADKVCRIVAEDFGVSFGNNCYCRFFYVSGGLFRLLRGIETKHAIIAETLEYFQEISLATSNLYNVLIVQLILLDEPAGCVFGPLSEPL